MTDFFCNIYSLIRSQYQLLERIRFNSVLRVIVRNSANILLPLYYKLTANCKHYALQSAEANGTKVIVSLTTFPARIGKVWLVVETMMRQSVKPDKIILWLSEEQFPTLDTLPKQLLSLRQRGLEIRLCPQDIRSHKKYYYTLKEYPEDIMITIDDDIFYHSKILENLLLKHKENPSAVVATHTHIIKFNDNTSQLLPYAQWERNVRTDSNLFLCSGGGTLFPPHSLYKDITNLRLALQLCPKADDVWLNAMAYLAHTNIIRSSFWCIPLPILNRHNVNLSTTNIGLGENDKQINALKNYYAKSQEQ